MTHEYQENGEWDLLYIRREQGVPIWEQSSALPLRKVHQQHVLIYNVS